jgi:acyl-coenzyme A thioesterase PaaI-like protein
MKLYETSKSESGRSMRMRIFFNWWPCLWCSGGKVEFIAGDFTELHVSLKLNIRTRNRVGTVYGGSIYSSVDPYFMLLLMETLGKDYVVWDKASSVKFVRPIIEKVRCRFLITDALVEDIKNRIRQNGEYTFDLPLIYEDWKGKVYATFNKTMYAADKKFYKEKMKAKELSTTPGK